jgi:hypothetical protein
VEAGKAEHNHPCHEVRGVRAQVLERARPYLTLPNSLLSAPAEGRIRHDDRAGLTPTATEFATKEALGLRDGMATIQPEDV